MSSYRMKYKIGATQYHIPVVDDMAGFGSGIPLGTILPYSANSEYPPEGFLWCDGSAVSRTAYPDLFALIGTLYGEGDGETIFNLPDLSGRFLEGESATNPVGMYKAAGLPNIEGASSSLSSANYTALENPFYVKNISGTGKTVADQNATATAYPYALAFDASLSNPIYGNSDTVQPSALTVKYIIKVFSAISTNSELVDVTELSADIAKKLYKDEPYTDNFAIIYPNGGTRDNPGSVAVSSVYIEPNPFPGYYVNCIVEYYYEGQWGQAFYAPYSGDYATNGCVGQHNGGDIVLNTGNYGFTFVAPGNAARYTSHMCTWEIVQTGARITSTVPCRVKVWKIGKI